jgi:hypothetical protein
MIIIAMPVQETLFDYVLHVLLFSLVFFFSVLFFLVVIYFSKVSGKFPEMIISMRPIFVIYARSRVWGGKEIILIQRLYMNCITEPK